MMKPRTYMDIALATGIVCGAISNLHFLASKWENILFWGIAGVVLGYFSPRIDRRYILYSGIVYGWSLGLTFLALIFGGTPDKIPAYILFVLVFSVLFVLCGTACVYTGSMLRKK